MYFSVGTENDLAQGVSFFGPIPFSQLISASRTEGILSSSLCKSYSFYILALEMAEGKAPYAEIHPMRAVFMIPTKPPPSFSQPDEWSPEFIDFVSLCLMKNPEHRATASELLQHEFIKNAKAPEILMDMIGEVQETKDQFQSKQIAMTGDEFGTMISANSGTLVKGID